MKKGQECYCRSAKHPDGWCWFAFLDDTVKVNTNVGWFEELIGYKFVWTYITCSEHKFQGVAEMNVGNEDLKRHGKFYFDEDKNRLICRK